MMSLTRTRTKITAALTAAAAMVTLGMAATTASAQLDDESEASVATTSAQPLATESEVPAPDADLAAEENTAGAPSASVAVEAEVTPPPLTRFYANKPEYNSVERHNEYPEEEPLSEGVTQIWKENINGMNYTYVENVYGDWAVLTYDPETSTVTSMDSKGEEHFLSPEVYDRYGKALGAGENPSFEEIAAEVQAEQL